ncbi:hypothetical protein VSA01S_37060 [Vibrio sagamiensis NBRC 104589]|uniref:VWFA domain-containing protein n=1 Tax=Vibrio sagamiensis NBRC 104589 TaxID=1219064 RepID=A0A511QJT6_9VIBR|nr:hypothetical protein VSA01S_37060 [Vibrio sagamiensis NBRC 104589]
MEYNTGSGWVTLPADGLVTVPAGMTEIDVRVPTVDDSNYEGPENFSVDVTGVGAVQGTDSGTATIVDDGTGPGPNPDDDRPTVYINDVGIVNEGETAQFVVSLTNAINVEEQVQLTLNLGDTEIGDLGTVEYNTGSGWNSLPPNGIVTIPAGLSQFDVRVPSVSDEVYEGLEDFSLTVTGLGAILGSDTGVAALIDDGTGPGPNPDDDRPMVFISDAGTVVEGEIANFVVSLNNPTEADSQVQITLNMGDTQVGDLAGLEYNTGSGWAVLPNDGIVTIPAGMTNFDVRVPTVIDSVYEGIEDFSVSVTGLGDVQGADTGMASIIDQNTAPVISAITDAVVSEEGLADGIPDSVGVPTDTTNAPSFNGSFTLEDLGSDNLSVVLAGPSDLVSSGEPVFWSWDSGSQTLTASTASVANVATVVLTEPSPSGQGNWGYTVTLFEPIDHPDNDMEDVLSFDLQLTVSDGLLTTTDSINVVVEDDSPYVDQSIPAVTVALTGLPETVSGKVSFTGWEDDAFSRTFNDIEVTAVGFMSDESTVLGAAEVNQSHLGIGVKSVGNNGFALPNEVDYRFAGDTGVSEQLIFDLGSKVAFGAEIEFEMMFGGELEVGLASFYLDGVLVDQKPFNSDAASGDYAKDFSILSSGFNKIVLESTGNGNQPFSADNSDFTVKSITFTGVDPTKALANANGTISGLYGADGPGEIALLGAENGLKTADGEPIYVSVDPSNPDRLIGETQGKVAFEVLYAPTSGEWEFFQYLPLTLPDDGSIDFSYNITDNDGDTKVGHFAVAPYSPPNFRDDIDLFISEEGQYPSGIEDDVASNGFLDTTDSASDWGHLTNGENIDSATLGIPNVTLTSNDTVVEWSLTNNDQSLLGKVGGNLILEITINDSGTVNTELFGPIDHSNPSGEDALELLVPVNVSNELGHTNTIDVPVVIEDDSPNSLTITHDVVAQDGDNNNIQLIFDLSGSVNVDNRLPSMKDTATQLLSQYESRGQARVQLVVFGNAAVTLSVAGATWLTVDDAKAAIAAFMGGGQSNYAAAIEQAQLSWDDSGKLSDAINTSYFLSCSQVTEVVPSLDATNEASWIEHLSDSSRQIIALSYGVGVNLAAEQLDRIAYDGAVNQDLDGVSVTDFSQLNPTILKTAIVAVEGNLLSTTSPDTGIGADGGYISMLEYSGLTFTFDGTALSVAGSNSEVQHSFDENAMTLTLIFDDKHTFEVNLSEGEYAFYGVENEIPETLDFNYRLTDFDGDKSSNTLQFIIDEDGGVNGAVGGAFNIVEAELNVSHDILIGNDGAEDIFTWSNDSIDSGTDIIRGFERDQDSLDLSEILDQTGYGSVEDLLYGIDMSIEGDDLSLEITSIDGQSIQTIVIENGATEFDDIITGNMDFDRDILAALTKANLDQSF